MAVDKNSSDLLVLNSQFSAKKLSSTDKNSHHRAKVILTVTAGVAKGKKFEFSDRTPCIIGRAKDCYPQIPPDQNHRTISRYHCKLEINPPIIRVRDLGSLNGTYVNGTKIGGRKRNQTPVEGSQLDFPEYDLKDGDEIKLGNTIFQVSIEWQGNADQTTQSPKKLKSSLETQRKIRRSSLSNESTVPVIQGYTTLRLLSKRKMSEVYLAQHDQTGEQVALKLMWPKKQPTENDLEIFAREIENLKTLDHPNIVQLRDWHYRESTFFFILEYCDGGSVVDLMQQRGGRLSIDEAVPIILQILDGLEYAHNAAIPHIKQTDGTFKKGLGIVHRDLKPSNILLSNIQPDHQPHLQPKMSNLAPRIVKLGDYGLDRAFDMARLSEVPQSGSKPEIPYFMPRQLVVNVKYAQPEVDIWGAVACFYYMITGHYPREFTDKDQWLEVLLSQPVPIRDRDSSIPKPLAELIDMALVDHPEINVKNAAVFKRSLSSLL